MRFDLWSQAEAIAERLGAPGSRVVLGVGSESCLQCTMLALLFDEIAAKSNAQETWLWLWQQEHAPFLPALNPAELPLICSFVDAELIACGRPDLDIAHRSAESLLAGWRMHPQFEPAARLILKRLQVCDWAS